MKRRKRILSLILAAVLLFTMGQQNAGVSVHATGGEGAETDASDDNMVPAVSDESQDILQRCLKLYDWYENITEKDQDYTIADREGRLLSTAVRSHFLLKMEEILADIDSMEGEVAAEQICNLEEHKHDDVCYAGESSKDENHSSNDDGEAGSADPACEESEHTHGEGCYEEKEITTCGQEEHTHEEVCMDGENAFFCELTEHTHEEDCYEREWVLVCKETEHIHSSDDEKKDDDKNNKEVQVEEVFICGMEGHIHGRVCYEEESNDERIAIWDNETYQKLLALYELMLDMPELGEDTSAFNQSKLVDGIVITVTAPEGVFPGASILEVRKIQEEDALKKIEQAVGEAVKKEEETKAVIDTIAFDITVADEEGNEIQPDIEKGEVSVTFSGVETDYEGLIQRDITVFHLQETGEASKSEDTSLQTASLGKKGGSADDDTEFIAETIDADIDSDTEEVAFQTEHFSIYTLTETATNISATGATTTLGNNVYTAESTKTISGAAAAYNTSDDTGTIGGHGLTVSGGATTVLHIPKGVTLTVNGGAGTGRMGGGAGIYVPSNSTLIIVGEGRLNATGGKSGSAGSATAGGSVSTSGSDWGDSYAHITFYTGAGGKGGYGAGSAGAGIGGGGKSGGSGGAGGSRLTPGYDNIAAAGNSGASGSTGGAGDSMGTVYILEKVTVTAAPGTTDTNAGSGGGGGSSAGWYHAGYTQWVGYGSGGGGGGGGIAGTSAGIGGSGSGGGGGGGGSSGGGYDLTSTVHCRLYIGGPGGGGGGGGAAGTTSSTCSGYEGQSSKSIPEAVLYQPTAAKGGTAGTTNGGSGGGVTAVTASDKPLPQYSVVGGVGGNRPLGGGAGTLYKATTATLAASGGGVTTAGAGVGASATAVTSYDIVHNLTNITYIPAAQADKYAGYACDLVPKTNYVLPTAITVVRGTNTTLTRNSGYSYNSTTGRVVIPYTELTDKITITAAGKLIVFDVTLTSGTITGDGVHFGTGKCGQGQMWSGVLLPKQGYSLPADKEDITITVNGSAITDFTYHAITGEVVIPGERITGAIEIIAEGTEKRYTVEFDTNGGGEAPPSKEVAYSEDITLPNITRDGFTLLGWSKSITAGAADNGMEAGDEVNGLTGINGKTVILYAVWKSSAGYPTSLQNGSFEVPVVTAWWAQFTQGSAQGVASQWKTTASDNRIEYGRPVLDPSGAYGAYGASAASDGLQFAELNAEKVGALYQYVAVPPGHTVSWGLDHKARNKDGAAETMQVWIGSKADVEAAINAYVKAGNKVVTSGKSANWSTIAKVAQVPSGKSGVTYDNCTLATKWSGDGTTWKRYTGSYTVPAGQDVTMFAFVSLYEKNATCGNLLDNIHFAAVPPPERELVTVNTRVGTENGGYVQVRVDGEEADRLNSSKDTYTGDLEYGEILELIVVPGEGYTYIGADVDGVYTPKNQMPDYWEVDDDLPGSITILFAKDSTVTYAPGTGTYTKREQTLNATTSTTETVGAPVPPAYHTFSHWAIATKSGLESQKVVSGNVIKYVTVLQGNNEPLTYLRIYNNAADASASRNHIYQTATGNGIALVAVYKGPNYPTVPTITNLKFNMDGGGMVFRDVTYDPEEDITLAGIEYTFVPGGNNLDDTVTLVTPTKLGFTFKGWRINNDGNKANYLQAGDTLVYSLSADSTASYLKIKNRAKDDAPDEITLTAIWEVRRAELPKITAHPQDKTLVYGYSADSISVTAATPTASDETLTYQWYESTDGTASGGTLITGATGTTLTFPAGKSAGEYQYYCVITSTVENTSITASEVSRVCTVTVEPRPVVLDWSGSSFTYDSTEKTVTAAVQNIVQGDTVTVTSYTNNKKTNVGDYTAAATGLSNSNYTLVGATGGQKVWSITKQVITVTAGNNTITYGDMPSAAGVTYTGFFPGDDASIITGTVTYTFDYNRYDDVGNYSITPGVSGLSAPNYTFQAVNGVLKVEPLSVVLDWTAGDFTYDGSQKTVSATVGNTVNSDSITVSSYTDDNNKQTKADSYTAEASGLGGAKAGNYTLTGGSNITNDWVIRKKKPDLTASATTISTGTDAEFSYTYSGDGDVSVSSENPGKVTAVIDEGTNTVTLAVVGSITDGETVNITLSAGEGENYLAADDVVIQVVLWDSEFAVSATSYSGVYDGTAHGIEVTNRINGTKVEYFDDDGSSWDDTLSSFEKKDVGNYTIKYRVVDDGTGTNFSGNITGESSITITEKPLLITAKDHTITYGSLLGNNGAVVGSLATGDTLAEVIGSVEYTYTQASYNAGTYAGAIIPQAEDASAAKAANYSITWVKGTLVVKAKPISIAWDTTGNPFTYDGSEKSISAVADNLEAGDTVALTLSNHKATGAGSYTASVIGLTGAEAGNYTLEGGSLTQSWSIGKANQIAPSADTTDETIDGKNDGTITDVDSTMEYKKQGDSTWIPIAGDSIEDLPDGTYEVRRKGDDNHNPSPSQSVTIDPGEAKSYLLTVSADSFDIELVGYTRPQANQILIESAGNWEATVTSVACSQPGKFEVMGNGSRVAAGGSMRSYTIRPVAGLAAGDYTTTITVTYNNSATATCEVSFEVAKRSAVAPSVSGEDETVDGKDDGKIKDVDDTMEYRPVPEDSSDTTGWITVTPDEDGNQPDLPPGEYEVRYKETDESNAGPSATVTIDKGADKTYTLVVTAPVFAVETEGYIRPAAKPVMIKSNGNWESTIASVTVSDSNKFELEGNATTVLPGKSITGYTIRPAAGLSPGTYTAIITVTYDNGMTATAQVVFTVVAGKIPDTETHGKGNSDAGEDSNQPKEEGNKTDTSSDDKGASDENEGAASEKGKAPQVPQPTPSASQQIPPAGKNGAGEVNVLVKEADKEKGILQAVFEDTQKVMDACLSDDERKAVENGTNIEIRLTVTVPEGEISREERNIVDRGLNELLATVKKAELGDWVELTLEKRLEQNPWIRIYETGDEIVVTIEIPEHLQDKDSYYLIGAHNETPIILQDLDDNPSTITVRAGYFGSYAIAYGTGLLVMEAHTDGDCFWHILIIITLVIYLLYVLLRKERKEEEEDKEDGEKDKENQYDDREDTDEKSKKKKWMRILFFVLFSLLCIIFAILGSCGLDWPFCIVAIVIGIVTKSVKKLLTDDMEEEEE